MAPHEREALHETLSGIPVEPLYSPRTTPFDYAGVLPDRITIFRLPHLEEATSWDDLVGLSAAYLAAQLRTLVGTGEPAPANPVRS